MADLTLWKRLRSMSEAANLSVIQAEWCREASELLRHATERVDAEVHQWEGISAALLPRQVLILVNLHNELHGTVRYPHAVSGEPANSA